LVLLLASCASVPPSGLVFGVMGDAPYNSAEVERLDRLIDDMNKERLDFVVHIGDIGGGRLGCSDAWLAARKQQFARLQHKFVLIPGDNEWLDCKDPAARLAAWRALFCAPAFALEVQSGEFCEHLRWSSGGAVFVTLNLPGHDNNVRNAAEHAHRMAAVLAWLDESAALAERRGATLVVLTQANPFLTVPRDGFVTLRERLAALGSRMPGKVVLVHGDTHFYQDDEPLPGLHRLQVWGSPIVSWIHGKFEAGEVRFSAPHYR
jgi:hypothetical protein